MLHHQLILENHVWHVNKCFREERRDSETKGALEMSLEKRPKSSARLGVATFSTPNHGASPGQTHDLASSSR